MKRYKPLLSSAPEHSILNAGAFHYTNSASTDIRATFERVRRRAAAKNARMPANVRTLPRSATAAPASSGELRRSTR